MRFFLCFLMIFLSGCMKETNATTTILRGTTGTSYPVERLFTIDSCGIFKITDGKNVGYVSVCPQAICTTEKVCPYNPTPKQHLEEDAK